MKDQGQDNHTLVGFEETQACAKNLHKVPYHVTGCLEKVLRFPVLPVPVLSATWLARALAQF